MKRSMKLIAAAAALGICLLLTGCYVSPDDDTNVEDKREPINTLVITTPTPTATTALVPDTVVVTPAGTPAGGNSGSNTDNNQPGNTVTSAPETTGSGSWTEWGSDGTVTPIPSGVTINLGDGSTVQPGTVTAGPETTAPAATTALPTTAVVTPTPTPPSLQIGFKGSESVRELQRRLKELGYYKGSIDGDFGENTEKAVKEFQKANGLDADGICGSKTLVVLFGY